MIFFDDEMPSVVIYLNRRYVYLRSLSTENPPDKFMWTKILTLSFHNIGDCVNMREEIRNDLTELDCISPPKDTRNVAFFFVENMLILQDYFRNKFNVYDIDQMLDDLSDDGEGVCSDCDDSYDSTEFSE